MTITPPGFIGGKVDDVSKVDEKTQSIYRSGVGTLLCLTKHSRPDITNPVRELSKSMDSASMAHVTEMYRVINFVLEMKTSGLRMEPIFRDGVWKLEALNDSDIMTKNQQGQHYMYAKSKLVYTVQEMNEKKAIEDIEDEETGRMLES